VFTMVGQAWHSLVRATTDLFVPTDEGMLHEVVNTLISTAVGVFIIASLFRTRNLCTRQVASDETG